ncbi:MAG TPA: cytochrome c [Blastocatellia bacterium]|jgi:mono/diheme cytochrome c family protein|nr:cytochrome c [Blastocatellia bacterium]
MGRFKGLATVLFIASLAACSGGLASGGSPQDKSAGIDGGKIFQRECADCHGADGRGRMIKQPDFTSLDWHKSVKSRRLFDRIKWGKEPMPFYAGALTDDEIDALVRHIRSLVVTTQSEKCSTCHRNADGEKRGRVFELD